MCAGFDIPSRYFHFLRTGNAASLENVLEHNRCDLVSLSAIMAQALWLAREGPDACRESGEQLALGRIYERAGEQTAAHRCYELAARSTDADVRRQALAHLARGLRRAARYEEAAEAWQQVLEMAPEGIPTRSLVDRHAAVALAIHHEHRRKDLAAARRYAEALARDCSGTLQQEVERRIQRLDRKLERRRHSLGEDLNFEGSAD